jgi:hypothetical protein
MGIEELNRVAKIAFCCSTPCCTESSPLDGVQRRRRSAKRGVNKDVINRARKSRKPAPVEAV